MSSTSFIAHSLFRGSAILIIWGSQSNLSIRDERALNDWWTNEHLPERLAIPGFHRTRRYYYTSKDGNSSNGLNTTNSASNNQSEAGPGLGSSTSHYLVIYEVASLATLTSPEYMHALNNPTPGTKKFMPVLASMNRSACNVLLSVSRPEFSNCKAGGVGGTLAHVVFQAPSTPETREGLKAYLAGDAWKLLLRFFPSMLAMRLLEHDEEASRSGSSTKSYEDVSFQNAGGGGTEDGGQRWMLLVELSDPFDAPYASYKEKCKEFADGLTEHGVDLTKLKEEIYGLVVTMEE